MPGGGGEEEIEMWRRRRRRYSAKEIQQKFNERARASEEKGKRGQTRERETESEIVGS